MKKQKTKSHSQQTKQGSTNTFGKVNNSEISNSRVSLDKTADKKLFTKQELNEFGKAFRNIGRQEGIEAFNKRIKELIKGDSHYKWTYQEIDKIKQEMIK